MTPSRLTAVASGLGLAVCLAAPVAAAPPAARTGPTLTIERFLGESSGEETPAIQKMVDANISKMRRLIQVTADDDPQKPDFFFRLGELYASKLRYFSEQAWALEPKIAAAGPAERSTLENQRRAYESVRQKWLLEAVKAYIAATKFRSYERMDAVLYRLIQLLASVGKDDQAREFFGRLQREYPKSSHLTAAKIALADAACGAGHLDDAVGLYEGVEQLPGERLGPYATYAKGWCYLDLGRTKEALESFVAVVMDSKPSILRGEAMRDLVRAYARSGSPERAWDFFEKVDPLAAASMMRSLIARYAAEGKPDAAARAAELARPHGVKVGPPDVSAPR